MSLKGVRQVAGSSSPLPSTAVLRDANGNVFANNFGYSQTSTVTSSTPVVLTAASSGIQVFTGSTSQTVTLPDATTLANGLAFAINNNSSATLTLNNAGNSLVVSIPAGGIVEVYVTSIASANGTWDVHPAAPLAVQWGSGTIGLIFNSALNTSPSIAAGASSATAPSFIPQRVAPTTGIGGTGTTVNAIVAGATVGSYSSAGLAITGALSTSAVASLNGGVSLTSVAGTSFVASTFTPAISIGGSAPTSYTTQVGNYLQLGTAGNGRIFFTITVRLNVAGVATGAVTFTGLPVAARAGAATERNSCAVYLTGQATGLTVEQIWATVAQGATVIDMWTYNAGTASAFSIGALSNSVQFNINGSYPI